MNWFCCWITSHYSDFNRLTTEIVQSGLRTRPWMLLDKMVLWSLDQSMTLRWTSWNLCPEVSYIAQCRDSKALTEAARDSFSGGKWFISPIGNSQEHDLITFFGDSPQIVNVVTYSSTMIERDRYHDQNHDPFSCRIWITTSFRKLVHDKLLVCHLGWLAIIDRHLNNFRQNLIGITTL